MQAEVPLNTEAPRRSTKEVDLELIGDLRQYELYRDDKIRDMHISYARNVVKNIAEGMPLERVVEIVGVEVVYKSLDIEKLYELCNYFAQENELGLRFDALFNVYKDDERIVNSGVTSEAIEDLVAYRAEQESTGAIALAKEAAVRVLGGFSLDILMLIVKSDLVADDLDNALVARHLNEQLTQAGSPVRFNQYLEEVDILT